MKTSLTMSESLKREKGMIFPQDFSEGTLLSVAHSKNCVTALTKQVQLSPIDDGAFGKCPTCNYEFNSELISEYNIRCCPSCGQALQE